MYVVWNDDTYLPFQLLMLSDTYEQLNIYMISHHGNMQLWELYLVYLVMLPVLSG